MIKEQFGLSQANNRGQFESIKLEPINDSSIKDAFKT